MLSNCGPFMIQMQVHLKPFVKTIHEKASSYGTSWVTRNPAWALFKVGHNAGTTKEMREEAI